MSNRKTWTSQEVSKLQKLRSQGKTNREIAQALGRTTKAVEIKTDHLDQPEANLEQLDYWKSKSRSLEKELAAANKSRVAVDVLCERVMELAPRSYKTSPVQRALSKDSHSTPQSAVLLFSDTHVGKLVRAQQTLGLGNYDFELFLRRLWRLEQSASSILQDHTTTDVPEIVIPILGDMIDGALQHSVEAGQLNTLLAQFYSAGHAMAQFFRNMSRLAPLRIYGTVGNHTRWGNQKKMPSDNRASNLDMFLYLYIQALVRDIPDIKFNLDWQPFACFDVQGFPFFCGHGDNLRGGDKILGIPNHSIGRNVSTINQLFSRAGKDTPAYFCYGHLHRPIELPHSKGEVLVNGSFVGIDGFALDQAFNSSYPLQKFFLMHPKFGRSACYELRLDLGDGIKHGYTLPDTFACQ